MPLIFERKRPIIGANRVPQTDIWRHHKDLFVSRNKLSGGPDVGIQSHSWGSGSESLHQIRNFGIFHQSETLSENLSVDQVSLDFDPFQQYRSMTEKLPNILETIIQFHLI